MTYLFRTIAVAAVLIGSIFVQAQQGKASDGWQSQFDLKKCTLTTTGRNPYFILIPGYQLVLESDEEKLQITVLDETEVVAGVTTRVVEEREWEKGKLHEVSRNFFAFCKETKDIYYFGEDVDFYKGKKVVSHEGAWRAGKGENRHGLIMPGAPKVGMKYYQEWAPKIALDRAEVVSTTETCKTPAGTFSNCLKVKEQNVRDMMSRVKFWEVEYKYHAPGIGLVQDEDLRLTKHGMVGK